MALTCALTTPIIILEVVTVPRKTTVAHPVSLLGLKPNRSARSCRPRACYHLSFTQTTTSSSMQLLHSMTVVPAQKLHSTSRRSTGIRAWSSARRDLMICKQCASMRQQHGALPQLECAGIHSHSDTWGSLLRSSWPRRSRGALIAPTRRPRALSFGVAAVVAEYGTSGTRKWIHLGIAHSSVCPSAMLLRNWETSGKRCRGKDSTAEMFFTQTSGL